MDDVFQIYIPYNINCANFSNICVVQEMLFVSISTNVHTT